MRRMTKEERNRKILELSVFTFCNNTLCFECPFQDRCFMDIDLEAYSFGELKSMNEIIQKEITKDENRS